jgi:dTDP-glucose 4,6-dehydratase
MWEEVRGRRLFITGGTGFFGVWLVETFLWANEQLALNARAVVLSRNPRAFCRKMPYLARHPALSFHQGDVRDFEFPEGSFSHVIHAATESAHRPGSTLGAAAGLSGSADNTGGQATRGTQEEHVGPQFSGHEHQVLIRLGESPSALLDTIVDGTRRVLEFARHCGAKKLLLVSSGAVYGPQPPALTHVGEDYAGAPDPMDPASAYGQGKRLAEQWCALCAERYRLAAKIARGFAFIGPHLPLDAHFAAGNFIRDALQGGPIVVRGDGTPYRSYLYAADLAVWLWTILFRGAACRPYNVGSARELTIAELAAAVAGAFRPALLVRRERQPRPGTPPPRYVPAVERAAQELGLRQTIDLRTAIERTVRWHQAGKHDEPRRGPAGAAHPWDLSPSAQRGAS